MATLFEETLISGMKLRNRVVRSATWEGMCGPAGEPTDKLMKCYRDLAEGGVGLIITGYTFVRPEGRQLPGKMGITSDEFADKFKALAKAVHSKGAAIAVQLVHAGGQADSENAGRTPVAPSSIETAQYPEVPQELTAEEIGEIVTAFADAAARVKEWGFDAVELHGAHGYLINQFLSPHLNKRTDDYGGGIEGRCRFLMEVYGAVREAVGADYPVMIKLTGGDNLEGGLTTDDAVIAAKKLSEAGIDAIEVSAGTTASGAEGPARDKIHKPEQEAYNLSPAARIKEAVKCPVIVVGGFRSIEVCEGAIEGGMDLVSMARPLIREPDLPNRWKSGDREKAECLSCNKCFVPGLQEGGIYCVAKKTAA